MFFHAQFKKRSGDAPHRAAGAFPVLWKKQGDGSFVFYGRKDKRTVPAS
jgi:hypothetical protein